MKVYLKFNLKILINNIIMEVLVYNHKILNNT